MQASVALERVRAFRGRGRDALLVGLGSAVAAFLYVAMRASTAWSVARSRSFAGYCQRVRPPDVYPCHLSFTAPARAYLSATLLLWVGLAMLVLVLVLAGRGAWSVAPLAVLGIVQGVAWMFPGHPLEALPWLGVRSAPFWTRELGAGYWAAHGLRASLADLALLAVPALLASLLLRPVRVPLSWRGRPAFVVTTVACLGAGTAVAWFANGSNWQGLGYATGVPIWVPASVIAVFGLLLPRAAWRPWSIGFVAVLLSAGPSALLVSWSLRQPTTLWFAEAVPLAVIGFLASAAEPLARWWEGRHARPGPTTTVARTSPRPLRSIVVLNALAVGLLAVSMIAARADTLPIRLSSPLPTYLGLRERADAERGERDLLMALDAFTVFRTQHRASRFDAAAGAGLEPALAWRDATEHTGRFAHFVISVARVTPSMVRFTTLTPSGGLCAQATSLSGWEPTFGAGTTSWGNGVGRSTRTAVRACGSRPLTAATIPDLAPLVDTMCGGYLGDGILVCRAVQHDVRMELASPRGP